jgi:hypothetical protein
VVKEAKEIKAKRSSVRTVVKEAKAKKAKRKFGAKKS